MIQLKSPREIDAIRHSCRLAAQTLEMIAPHVQPGVTTEELDRICHDYITQELGAIPAPLNYRGFPKSICTSIDEVICHGIPSPKHRLRSGQIIKIDVSVIKDGFYGDTCYTFFVGKPGPEAKKIAQVSRESLRRAIQQVKPGKRLGDVGWAIQSYVEKEGCSVVRDFSGHGIGRQFHEEPTVYHFGQPGTGTPLVAGMVFTIEPMVNLGTYRLKVLSDGWTAVTLDKKLSAQFEHTIAVTEEGYEVLTLSSLMPD